MNDAALHQVDYRRVAGKRRAGKPHQVARAEFGCGLERLQRDDVAIAQVMMRRDGHAIPQATQPQRRREIGNTLVAVGRIVDVRADRRRGDMSLWTMLRDTGKRRLLAPIHRQRNFSTGSVADQFDPGRNGAHAFASGAVWINPMWRARCTSFSARWTTGGSIIFEPRLTTARPCACASSNAATIFIAFSISAAVGANASCTTATCAGWMQPMPSKPSARERSAHARRPSMSATSL